MRIEKISLEKIDNIEETNQDVPSVPMVLL